MHCYVFPLILIGDRIRLGSYSDSMGVRLIREHITEYLETRDDHYTNISDIFMLNGAAEGVRVSSLRI